MSLFRPLLRVQRSFQIGRAFSQTASNKSARISIIGRLGAKPQFVAAANGTEMIRYFLATSYGKWGRETTSWFRVGCFVSSEALKQSMMKLDKGMDLLTGRIEFLDKLSREGTEKQAAESGEDGVSEVDADFEGDEESNKGDEESNKGDEESNRNVE
ncbi:ssDNA-binding protein, mitochondrial [Sticta canariensis]|nr:ssDNA-binding protein, mitochondrial [Sticta canariensis]